MHAEADVLQSAYCDHSCCNKGLASAVRLSFITVICQHTVLSIALCVYTFCYDEAFCFRELHHLPA